MPEEDLLYTLAEIAIAIAGFSGLVTILSRRDGRSADQAALDLQSLQGVLGASLTVVAFSVLPGALVHMGLSPATAWRGSSAAFSLGAGAYLLWSTPRYRAKYAAAGQPNPRTLRLHIVLAAGVVLALAASALSFLPKAVHVIGLLAYLYMAAYSFIRVFSSLGRIEPGD
jgi:hypothetical protein